MLWHLSLLGQLLVRPHATPRHSETSLWSDSIYSQTWYEDLRSCCASVPVCRAPSQATMQTEWHAAGHHACTPLRQTCSSLLSLCLPWLQGHPGATMSPAARRSCSLYARACGPRRMVACCP